MSETVRTHARVRASELVGRNWLNTGGKSLDLEALRGKIVLLDFWTFCCINCLHVLDELRPLEEQYSDVLVTVGVHSPKFEHEADPVALAAAVERYEIHHPVLDDPELDTWKAYTARAWPTLVVIDPEGYIVAHLSGEGHADGLAVLIPELIAEHEAKGTLHRGTGPYVAPEATSGTLRVPGKALFLPPGRGSTATEGASDGGTAAGAAVADPADKGSWLVTDTGHHRLVELGTDFHTVLGTFGSGTKGYADGPAADNGEFYGERKELSLDEIKSIVTAMTEREDCVDPNAVIEAEGEAKPEAGGATAEGEGAAAETQEVAASGH